MIKRERELKLLLENKDLDLVKIIVGVRRCGKSTLLDQYNDLLIEKGVKPEDIIFIKFESGEYYNITDYKVLYSYVKNKITNNSKKYILLDEVQYVEHWERAVNSFMVDFNCDIYITGSNAYLLSSELSTLIAGRYIEIKLYPLSFNEMEKSDLYQSLESDNRKFNKYLRYGGMPLITSMKDKQEIITAYLNDLRDVILKKDVIDRNKIKDVIFLNNLLKYMASTIGTLTNPNNIAEYMAKNGKKIDNETVDSYLSMLENAYIIYKLPRYDLQGKQLLKTQGKYYFVDSGLKNATNGYLHYDSGSSLENIVYLELRRQGYDEIYVGKYGDIEVDFVAEKNENTIYIQVTKSLENPEVENREVKSLLSIKDNYRKIIVTTDDKDTKSLDGIEIINIIDFLENISKL